jgi:hypothetical protein
MEESRLYKQLADAQKELFSLGEAEISLRAANPTGLGFQIVVVGSRRLKKMIRKKIVRISQKIEKFSRR